MKVHISDYNEDNTPRESKVQIDPWDTVNVDSTLSLIALPLLKQYRKNMKGAPYVENEDVPPEMYQEVDNYDGWDKRWAWVVDEMINAFERLADPDWSDDFYEGEKFHAEAWQAEEKRIDNGLRLFGKYFRGLWQ
jgi:hypothetical protein